MCPHDVTDGSESPRKARADSERMAPGTVNAKLTYVRETRLGNMCLTIILPVPAPEALAASTNGLSLTVST